MSRGPASFYLSPEQQQEMTSLTSSQKNELYEKLGLISDEDAASKGWTEASILFIAKDYFDGTLVI